MDISKTCFIFCLLSQFLGNAAASLAVTKLDFDASQPLTNQVIKSGKIKVQVSYQPIELNEKIDENSDINNVSYQIFYDEQLYQQNSEYSAFGSGYVELRDLDNNGIDEIIVSTYSGG
jgi:spore coat protein U-like protein